MIPVQIDTSKVGKTEKYLLGCSLLDALQKHFDNPENKRRFEEWQKRRSTKK